MNREVLQNGSIKRDTQHTTDTQLYNGYSAYNGYAACNGYSAYNKYSAYNGYSAYNRYSAYKSDDLVRVKKRATVSGHVRLNQGTDHIARTV